jgi:hypothetical protein
MRTNAVRLHILRKEIEKWPDTREQGIALELCCEIEACHREITDLQAKVYPLPEDETLGRTVER